ncbi:MAG: PEP/pyruvate-binding domain-containing protein [Thermoanaerobaculia bacterium]|jgi:pyruvate,water dikinase
MMNGVLSWPEAFEAGTAVCGGKGWNLARLARYGFAVPEGGVLPAVAYAALLARGGIAELSTEIAAVDGDRVADPDVSVRLGELQSRIVASRLAEDDRNAIAAWLRSMKEPGAAIAVRSSATAEDGATASFAGIHRSVLGVRGIDAVERAVLACYASLWTPQALAYRRRMGFRDDEVHCAVVLCAMVTQPGGDEPSCAGVAFSADPMTGRRDLVVIESARGIGEHVVDGSVDPDRVALRRVKDRYLVESRRVQGAAVLTPGQECELARIVSRIHWALGDGQDPQDVEWAHDGSRFVIVQSRPVTRIPHYAFAGAEHLPVHWSTANIKDAVPGVYSALGWSLVQETVGGVLYGNVTSAGIEDDTGVQAVRRIDGRAFFDVSGIQWRLYDTLGVTPKQVCDACGGHQPEIAVPNPDPFAGPEGKRRKKAQLRLLRALWSLPSRLDTACARHLAEAKRFASIDVARCSIEELRALMGDAIRMSEGLETLAGLANGAAGVWHEPLKAQLVAVAGERSESLLLRLLTGSGGVTSADHGYRIYDLAAIAKRDTEALEWLRSGRPAGEWTSLAGSSPFRQAFARFLDEFGHRGIYEGDAANPRWGEDPSFIVDQVREAAEPGERDPREIASRVRREAERELCSLTFVRRPLIRFLATKLQRATARREQAKSMLVASLVPLRRIVLELARRLTIAGRLDDEGQVFDLCLWDVFAILDGEWNGDGARELARDRAAQRAAWLAMPAPADVITIEPDGRAVSRHDLDAPREAGEGTWIGVGVSGGVADGSACVVVHPREGAKLGRGEILVAPSTDPGWTPLFLRAAALVTETGGFLSHGATVAREYGIPAVVNIAGIVRELGDGERLRVDGDAGSVARIDPK